MFSFIIRLLFFYSFILISIIAVWASPLSLTINNSNINVNWPSDSFWNLHKSATGDLKLDVFQLVPPELITDNGEFKTYSESLEVSAFFKLVDSRSMKKGMAFSSRLLGQWNYISNTLRPTWHYTWGSTYFGDAEHPADVEWVPMLWGKGAYTEEKVLELKPMIESGFIKNILLFNEPDLEAQSNVSVSEAVQLTLYLQQKFVENGIPLESVNFISPVVAYQYDEWLYPYLAQATAAGCKIDYICMHKYVTNSSASNFITSLQNRYNEIQALGYDKKVWLKEFSLKRKLNGSVHSLAAVEAFMNGVLTFLEGAEWIHRYAWFSASYKYTDGQWVLGGNRQEDSVLWDNRVGNGSSTNLGDYYRSF